jgi:dTDP-4-amino-4,6-dideoxygalactose transaminase
VNIPLVDLKKGYLPLKDEILGRVAGVLDGMGLYLGENVQALEREFAQFCGAKHGIAVSDGTTALTLSLRACGIGPGDEVITVSHTFFATVEAITLAGARPVFVDIDPSSMLMNTGQIEALITARTRAILPVHLYGQTADMTAIMEIAARHNLMVVEDACQAHGADQNGKRAGSLGHIACFSFYFSKNLGAYGEGGFVTTNDDALAEKVRLLHNHGSARRYEHDMIGINGRLDEIQAAILRVKLPHLADWDAQRREHAQRYNDALAGLPVLTPVECPGNTHVYHLYVIRAPHRDELQAWLRERGVATGIHYPIPNHLQNAVRGLGYREGDLPATETVCREILSLPMYPELTAEEIDYVVEAIKDFFARDGASWQ